MSGRDLIVQDGDVQVHGGRERSDLDDSGNSLSDTIRQSVDRQLVSRGEQPRYETRIAEDKARRNTPSRYSNLPPSVKQEIAEYAPLAPYAALAKRNGTTIADAVANYSRLENTLMKNPMLGYAEIMVRMGHSPKQVVDTWLPFYNASQQEFDQGVVTAMSEANVQTEIAKYSHLPHWQFLIPTMQQFLYANQATDLPSAYRMAARHHGIKVGTQAAQPRARNLETGGSSGHSSAPAAQGRNSRSIRDDIRAAYEQQGGY